MDQLFGRHVIKVKYMVEKFKNDEAMLSFMFLICIPIGVIENYFSNRFFMDFWQIVSIIFISIIFIIPVFWKKFSYVIIFLFLLSLIHIPIIAISSDIEIYSWVFIVQSIIQGFAVIFYLNKKYKII